MKKIMIVMAVMFAAVASNAASFKWQIANAYSSDLSSEWSGTITLMCEELADWSVSATASNGTILAKNTEFSSDLFVAGSDYTFYYVITDGDKTLVSEKLSVGAQKSDVATINFGNQQSYTQGAGNWSAVPEPTSAMLIVLGVAALALRRKQK